MPLRPDRPFRRRVADVLRVSARVFAALISAILPPLLLGWRLSAEGPLWVVPVVSALIIMASALALRHGSAEAKWIRFGRKAAFVVALIAGAVAVFVILVQLNVARRSLAEAWLELARAGEAFGFFSFFAVEIYALLCVSSSLFHLSGRPAAAFVGFIAVTLLCLGLIFGLWFCLATAGLIGFIVPFLAFKEDRFLQRVRAALPALAGGLVVTALLTLATRGRSDEPLIRPLDLTPLVVKAAPTFPLLLDVPGYGYGVGVGRSSAVLYLSEGILFYAEGEAESVHYLVSDVYEDWSGSIWRPATTSNRQIAVERTDLPVQRPYGALRLTLAEDFYSLFPLERSTTLVRLPAKAPPTMASADTGLRFQSNARRGLSADLIIGFSTEPGPPPESSRLGYLGEAFSPDFKRLAAELAEEPATADRPAETDDADSRGGSDDGRQRRIVVRILDYLAKDFSYSLTVASPNSPESIERFLFRERKGYCLHFASAFALLCRAAGLSSRLIEGFRLSLDETGRGAIRGQHSHAWAEVWLDGAWRSFEPTPPFAANDPFAYWDGSDRGAFRQLNAIFGAQALETLEDGASIWGRRLPLIAFGMVAGLGFAAILISWIGRKRDSSSVLRRRAARLVRRYRAAGIPGPDRIGWTGWAAAVVNRPTRAGMDGTAVSRRRAWYWRKEPTTDEIWNLSRTLLRTAFAPPRA